MLLHGAGTLRTAVALVFVSLTALSAQGQTPPPEAGNTTPQPGRVAPTRVRTDHLEIRTRVSDDIVAPGVPFTLVVDIAPRSGVHVYAPGATDYRVIELAMTPVQGVTFRRVRFPPAEIYDFVPLNEHIPVYQKPFQLIQSVTVHASSRSSGQLTDEDTLTIKAALNYQACDDRICFSPVSVPLSWTVKIKQGGM